MDAALPARRPSCRTGRPNCGLRSDNQCDDCLRWQRERQVHRNNAVWTLSNANGMGGTPVWQKLVSAELAPSPRIGHRAFYDPSTNRMTVFAGSPGNYPEITTFNDTWVLSNANGKSGLPAWTKLAPTFTSPARGLPGGRVDHTVVYDSTTNRGRFRRGKCRGDLQQRLGADGRQQALAHSPPGAPPKLILLGWGVLSTYLVPILCARLRSSTPRWRPPLPRSPRHLSTRARRILEPS